MLMKKQPVVKALMLQGTGSDVGKSVLVAGLCRIAYRRGYRVAPFKPQNMSNNAHACAGGGEIGRAQALQAQAAGIEPHVDMNPVLLKPQSDQMAQVVVQGRVADTLAARDYMAGRQQLLNPVLDSFRRLGQNYDLIFVEGAGSPAETNLRDRDIANMGFARAAGVPVCLVGDIDRGGVIAALAGTQQVLEAADAAHVVGFVINKFRGDVSLFADGVRQIETLTSWPCWGVLPWLSAATRLPAEDAVQLQSPENGRSGRLKIVAPMFSRVANFDDMDPLRMEPDVDFSFVPPDTPLPADADVVILLGTKSSMADLAFLRAQGWHHDIYSHVRRGGAVLGICGGYQMLGKRLTDPLGNDGQAGEVAGLGLLDVVTHMRADKTVRQTRARCVQSGIELSGYEIHSGETSGADTQRPMFKSGHGADGAGDGTGQIQGCYLHGLFANDQYRRHWLAGFDPTVGGELHYATAVSQALDELAVQMEAHLNIDALFAACSSPAFDA